MMRIKPGFIQTLAIAEITDKGYLLGDDHEKAFLPKRELKPKTEVGTEVEVFVFYNEDRQLEATTVLPNIQVGQLGCFRVGNSNDLGSFINIGIRRDILIPHKEQVETLEEGKMALVILLDDPENKRIYGSTKLNRHFRNTDIPYKRGDEVSMVIAEKIEIGRRVIIDGKYIAALFRQEMTDKVRLGEKVKGYIRKVEGKDIVVSMQREGLELLDDSKAKLMQYLEQNGGYVRLNDDTDPEEVKLRLHMSKKAFKKAAGMLFKEGKVLLTKFGIKINKTGELPKEWERNKLLVEEDDDPSLVTSPQAKRRVSGDDDDDDEPKSREKSGGYDRRRSDDRGAGPDKPFRRKEDKPFVPDSDKRKTYKKSDDKPREHRADSDRQKPVSRPTESDERSDKPKETGAEKKPVKQLTFRGKKQ